MTPYFENINNWNAYYKELLEWIGTPYRHMTKIKGRGADCTLFVGSTLVQSGILTAIYGFESYSQDWHLHGGEDLVVKSYTEGAKFLKSGLSYTIIDGCPDDLMRGDMLMLSTIPSGVVHHAAIFLGEDKMIHCIRPRGVQVSFFQGWWKRHVKNVIRIMEETE